MRSVTNSSGFRNVVLRATAWSLGGHLAGQVLRMASSLIMTRLLVPEMFGVMALANVILIGLTLFTDIGLNQGVIQSRRGHDPAYLNTAWTVQILRGVVICFFAMLLAAALHLTLEGRTFPESSVYANPLLPSVIFALSFNALISGFVSTRLAVANRNMMLGRVTTIELVSQIVALLVMIVWALINRSIWALVAGSLVASALRVVMSHTALQGERNYLHWDSGAFKEIFGFGKWIFLTSILGFLSANGDRLILGWLVDPVTLGFYSIAFFLASALQEALSKLAASVAFPALSQVARENRDSLKRTYYQFRLPFDVVTLLSTGILFAAGRLLVEFFYDIRYLPAGHMVEILCIGLFEVRYALAGQCYMAIGMPKLLAPIILIRLIAVFGLMPLAFSVWGLEGALWIAGGSVLFTIPLTIYYKIKNGLFDLQRELLVLPLPIIGYGVGIGVLSFVSLFK